jgi:hypothetical protein
MYAFCMCKHTRLISPGRFHRVFVHVRAQRWLVLCSAAQKVRNALNQSPQRWIKNLFLSLYALCVEPRRGSDGVRAVFKLTFCCLRAPFLSMHVYIISCAILFTATVVNYGLKCRRTMEFAGVESFWLIVKKRWT